MITLSAATLTDPWASLSVAGVKLFESRKGPMLSGFSGPLVIHRSKADCDGYDIGQWGVRLPKRPEGWPFDDRGCALGIVYVVRTFRYQPDWFTADHAEFQRDCCFADIEGRYLSELRFATWLTRPIPCRGAQGRWQIQLPDGVIPDSFWLKVIEHQRVTYRRQS